MATQPLRGIGLVQAGIILVLALIIIARSGPTIQATTYGRAW